MAPIRNANHIETFTLSVGGLPSEYDQNEPSVKMK
jgi:hypothetical protein